MPRYDSESGRWVRALAADMDGGPRAERQLAARDGGYGRRLTPYDAGQRLAPYGARRSPAYGAPRAAGRQPAPRARDFTARLALALALRPMPPRVPPVSRARPQWFPGLLTTFALVLTCLVSAAAQGVLPAPWREAGPPGGTVAEVRWRVAGELRPQVGAGALVFSPADRNRLMVVGAGGVEAWDVADTGRPRMVYLSRMPDAGPASALGVDSDRRTVLAASDEQLLTWDTGVGVLPWLEFTPDVRGVKALRKRTESLDIVVRRSRNLTVLREAATNGSAREGFQTTASLSQAAHAAQFSPDGNTLAIADDLGNVQLWDLTRNYEPTPKGRQLNTGARLPRALAFSADAALLAVIGKDDVVRLWDITHPDRPRHLGNPVQLPARAVAFGPDPHLVATAGPDGTVSLWRR
ncbi:MULTISPECIES: WD40 repeat domain-containing protein [unclassified Streptomyces]|uniref:WD40 repeat domain-containing protein n=1 Tax=unclassified Streptomyces TaxID=2593676 RepID=UPI0013A69FF2|nr:MULTISPECIES: WD40 repeat domain-containing protein [unclassified Streptomyces]QZZ30338.1 WD40 repeat domain-containing protein [Streptomyces sp. ST1015]